LLRARSGYGEVMSIDAIKEAITALPGDERHSLASWLNDLDYDDWDKEMAKDFSPRGSERASRREDRPGDRPGHRDGNRYLA